MRFIGPTLLLEFYAWSVSDNDVRWTLLLVASAFMLGAIIESLRTLTHR